MIMLRIQRHLWCLGKQMQKTVSHFSLKSSSMFVWRLWGSSCSGESEETELSDESLAEASGFKVRSSLPSTVPAAPLAPSLQAHRWTPPNTSHPDSPSNLRPQETRTRAGREVRVAYLAGCLEEKSESRTACGSLEGAHTHIGCNGSSCLLMCVRVRYLPPTLPPHSAGPFRNHFKGETTFAGTVTVQSRQMWHSFQFCFYFHRYEFSCVNNENTQIKHWLNPVLSLHWTWECAAIASPKIWTRQASNLSNNI